MNLKVFDLEHLNPDTINEIVKSLHETGCLVVKNNENENKLEDFLNLMEQYFSQSHELKMQDVRPESGYQVGATPENTETSRCVQNTDCIEEINKQTPENKAVLPTGADPKWRFFWRIGSRPEHTEYQRLNAKQVVPHAFKDTFPTIMNNFGENMLNVIYKVAHIIELGLNLHTNQLTDLLEGGAHLLAPTGTNIEKYNKINTVYAGYHYDISFLTIHGKSRYSGLNIWLRNGQKIAVKIPDNCLLLQVGKQLEWLTGGYFKAGYHEVICKKETIDALDSNLCKWRVSSTLFAHVNSDKYLEPIGRFKNKSELYPKIKEGDFLQNELKHIKLI